MALSLQLESPILMQHNDHVKERYNMAYEAQNQQEKQTISVELTLNEALALTGVRFPQNHQLEVDAMSKIKRSLENQIILDPKRKTVQ